MHNEWTGVVVNPRSAYALFTSLWWPVFLELRLVRESQWFWWVYALLYIPSLYWSGNNNSSGPPSPGKIRLARLIPLILPPPKRVCSWGRYPQAARGWMAGCARGEKGRMRKMWKEKAGCNTYTFPLFMFRVLSYITLQIYFLNSASGLQKPSDMLQKIWNGPESTAVARVLNALVYILFFKSWIDNNKWWILWSIIYTKGRFHFFVSQLFYMSCTKERWMQDQEQIVNIPWSWYIGNDKNSSIVIKKRSLVVAKSGFATGNTIHSMDSKIKKDEESKDKTNREEKTFEIAITETTQHYKFQKY